MPKEISFDGAYPNPFNPATMLKFSVPSTMDVEVSMPTLEEVKEVAIEQPMEEPVEVETIEAEPVIETVEVLEEVTEEPVEIVEETNEQLDVKVIKNIT